MTKIVWRGDDETQWRYMVDEISKITGVCCTNPPEAMDAVRELAKRAFPSASTPPSPCDHDYVWVQETELNGTQYRCDLCGHVKWEKRPTIHDIRRIRAERGVSLKEAKRLAMAERDQDSNG